MFNFNPSWLLRSFGFGAISDKWDNQNRQGSMAKIQPAQPQPKPQQQSTSGLMSQKTGPQQLIQMAMDYKPPAQPKPPQPKPIAAPVQTAPRTPEPAMQTTGAMSQQPSGVSYGQSSALGANYRPPAQSAWANFENPFTPERQRLLEAQAIQQAEEQASVTAGRLGSQLAGAGLMSGGGTGLSQSMAQQLAMQTEGQRSQALRDIALQVPMQRAELEARRAAGLDAYAPTAFGMSERIALQPSTIRRAEAEADIAGITASRGEQMLPLDIQRAEEEINVLQEQGTAARLQNALGNIDLRIKGNQDVINAEINKLINQGQLSGVELQAARNILSQNDPNAWWNNEWWRFFKEGTLSVLAGVAQGAGRAAAGGG